MFLYLVAKGEGPVKNLPNILSCLRIALSAALLFVMANPVVFLIIYALCGISDIADGYIARKYNAHTKLGAKLDSAGDFVLFGVTVYVLFALIDKDSLAPLVFVVVLIAAIRAMNLAITKVKFKQWGIMHTVGNKITGFALFAALPVCNVIGYIPVAVIITVGAIGALSAIEESCILLTQREYDANRKSIVCK